MNVAKATERRPKWPTKNQKSSRRARLSSHSSLDARQTRIICVVPVLEVGLGQNARFAVSSKLAYDFTFGRMPKFIGIRS